MGPTRVRFVSVIVLGLSASLLGPSMIHAETTSEPNTGTTILNVTRLNNQCSPLQRRQDLLDQRLNERETRLNGLDQRLNERDTRLTALHTQINGLSTQLDTRQKEVNVQFDTINTRLDGIDTAISDMKAYVQQQIAAMNKKVEWALTETRPQSGATGRESSNDVQQPRQVYHCPANFVLYEGYCYFSDGTKDLTWDNARAECQDKSSSLMPTDLASILSESENDFIYDTMRNKSYSSYWIGLKRSADDAFYWVDGNAATYRKWNTGEPNNAGNNEDCVEGRVSYNTRWNDQACNDKAVGYICKAKAYITETTAAATTP